MIQKVEHPDVNREWELNYFKKKLELEMNELIKKPNISEKDKSRFKEAQLELKCVKRELDKLTMRV